jgi:hypothetical protein
MTLKVDLSRQPGCVPMCVFSTSTDGHLRSDPPQNRTTRDDSASGGAAPGTIHRSTTDALEVVVSSVPSARQAGPGEGVHVLPYCAEPNRHKPRGRCRTKATVFFSVSQAATPSSRELQQSLQNTFECPVSSESPTKERLDPDRCGLTFGLSSLSNGGVFPTRTHTSGGWYRYGEDD